MKKKFAMKCMNYKVQALQQNEYPEELPDEVHKLRKAYERCGLSVTSASIFDEFKTTSPPTRSRNNISREDFMNFIASTQNNLAWSQLGFKWNNIIEFVKEDRETFTSINVQDIITWFEDQDDNIEISELNLNQLSMLSKILSKNEKFDFEKFYECFSLDEILLWDEDQIDDFSKIDPESLDVDYNISLPELVDYYYSDKEITLAILRYEDQFYNIIPDFNEAYGHCQTKLEQKNYEDDEDHENAYENLSCFEIIDRSLNEFMCRQRCERDDYSTAESSSDDL